MPIIEMPDGTELEFPEGMDRGKMREAIRSKYSSGNETGGDELIATAGPGAPDAIPAESPPTKRQLLDAGIKESQRQSKYYTGKANALDFAERSLDVPGAFKSLINLPNRLTGQPDYPALVSPEQVQKVGEFLNPLAPGALPQDEVTQGLLKGGAEVASGLTSPDVAAAALLAKKYPVPVSTLFAGETLGAIPEATRSLLESKTPGEAAERAVPTAANLLLTKLLANHLVGKGPVIPKPGPPTDIPPEAAPVEAAPESPAPVTTATLDRLEAEAKAKLREKGVSDEAINQAFPETEASATAEIKAEKEAASLADENKVVSWYQQAIDKVEGKEPWEVTKQDYSDSRAAKVSGQSVRKTRKLAELVHKGYVRDALMEGKPVQAEVLADYPDLKAAIETATTKAPVAKAQAQVTKVAKTEGVRAAKEIKSELVQRISEAMSDAKPESSLTKEQLDALQSARNVGVPRPERGVKDSETFAKWDALKKEANDKAVALGLTRVTIDIPGDGKFTVWNTVESLQELQARAKRLEITSGNPVSVKKSGIPKEDADWVKAQIAEQSAQSDPANTYFIREGEEWKPVHGKRVIIPGYEDHDFFVSRTSDNTRYTVSEAKSGSNMGGYGSSAAKAIEATKERLSKIENVQAVLRDAIKSSVDKYGQSPRFKPPQAEAGTRVPPPEPGSMGASLGITGPLPPVNLDVGPIAAAIKGFAGHTLPKFTAKLRAAGEAGARYLSSKIAAPYNSILFSTKVLESGVDAKKFGAALTEDNLRSIRADFYREAADARSQGDHDLADELDRKAANVRSLIGARNSFQTEAEYQRFLHDPTTQEAIRVHKQLWESEIDPQYKKAQGLDPDLDLPTRGLQTGARINLKALLDDELGRSVITAGRGSMLSTFRKKSPFAREAKGTGQRYEYDYNEIIANTFAKQSEIANQNDFHRILVENGLAKVAAKRPDMVAGEAPSRPYPLQRRLILSDGKAFAENENLYLPQSLEAEYRTASNLDAAARVPFVKGFINLLNKGAIVSLSEATGHLWNLADAAFNLPKGKLLTDTLLKVAGRSDVVPTLFSVLRKSLADNKQQLAELATIGAMREHFSGIGPGNKVITWFDQTVRLILDDAYKGLRDSGLVENSETARREFVNQVGQYNTRAQGPLIRLLRDTGLGPFATAGRAFNVLGIKRMLLHPGVEASGTAASFALRANVLGSIVGFFVLRGVLNQVLSGNPNGRKGTRLMDVDLGLKDKTGKSMVIPLGDLLGPGRGARVTGVRGAVEAKRTGLNNAEAGDAAMRDIISSVISPAWGPAMRFGSTLIAGKQTPFSPQVAPQAKPGQNQFALNAGTAVKEANPFLSTGIDLATGKDVDTTKLAGRVAPQSRRTEEKEAVMPKIVDRAKTKDYKEWLIREAMNLPRSERSKFVNEHSKDAGFTERDKGDIQSRLRH